MVTPRKLDQKSTKQKEKKTIELIIFSRQHLSFEKINFDFEIFFWLPLNICGHRIPFIVKQKTCKNFSHLNGDKLFMQII